MDQQSSDWHEWRGQGLGSSDAPVIMKVSPWKTPFQLWEEKTGQRVRNQETKFAQERGNELEPYARAHYELSENIEMGPALVQHEKYPFLRASMDGWNPQAKIGLEIKFVGLSDHELAQTGKLPEKYYPQVQHQLLVTGADRIDYYSYYVPKGLANHQGLATKIAVYPDMDFIAKYFKEALAFHSMIETMQAPPFLDGDFKPIRVKGSKALATEYADLVESKLDHYDVNDLVESIFKLTGEEPRYRMDVLRIFTKERKIEIWRNQG